MSMTLMVAAMKSKVGNPLRKLVLIKLADNANDEAYCWPSYQHISDQCEISKSTVRKHIKDLSDSGFLRIEHRTGPKGNSSNIYHLTIEQGCAVKDPMPSESIPMPSESTGGVPSDDTRTSHSFESVKEPITLSPNGSASGDAGVQELELNEPLNTDQPGLKESGSSAADKVINIPFDDWWTIYGKKVDRKKCERKWSKLSNKTRLAIIEHTPKYVRATPEDEYRKNPYTYLNSETWNDEQLPTRSQGWPNASYPTNQNNTKVDVDAALAPRAVRRQESTPEQLKRNQEQAANLLNMFKGG